MRLERASILLPWYDGQIKSIEWAAQSLLRVTGNTPLLTWGLVSSGAWRKEFKLCPVTAIATRSESPQYRDSLLRGIVRPLRLAVLDRPARPTTLRFADWDLPRLGKQIWHGGVETEPLVP